MTTPITERQEAFIRSLMADRVCNEAAILNDMPFYSTRDASAVIDALLKAPKKTAASAAAPKGNPNVRDMIKSKYAVPTSEIAPFADMVGLENAKGDLLFVEVKEYRGTVYMRRLHGAPGSFTRSRLSRDAENVLADLIKADAYRYTKMFGEHYRCCGKCGAELTDEVSRRLQLGPECRKAFAL